MLFLTHKILDLNSITECPTGNHPQKTIRNGKRKERKKKENVRVNKWDTMVHCKKFFFFVPFDG